MDIRLGFVVVAMCCLLVLAGRAPADDAPKPDLKPLLAEVRKIVEKHYPKAKVTLKDGTIHFEFNTRTFMIHEPLLTGVWQDAHKDEGPQPGGIYGDMTLYPGEYEGMAVLPHSFDKRYFTVLGMDTYSKRLDHHLFVHLKYPRDVSKEFLKEFADLVDGFE